MLKQAKDNSLEKLLEHLNEVSAFTISIHYVGGEWIAIYKVEAKTNPKQKKG